VISRSYQQKLKFLKNTIYSFLQLIPAVNGSQTGSQIFGAEIAPHQAKVGCQLN